MEDNLDTILYIIIALVAFVISAIGKKKKPAGQPGQSTQPFFGTSIDSDNPFISELEELLQDNSYKIAKSNEALESIKMKNDEQSSLIEKESFLTKEYNSKNRGSISDNRYDNPIKENEITESETNGSVSNEFDLKQAVIYSEILNRIEY